MADRPAQHLDTTAITSGRQASGDSLAPVLFPSTAYEVGTVAEQADQVFTARPDKLYSRFGSPSVRELEAAVAELEGAEAALASASGMGTLAAVLLGLCSSGDHIVASRQIFSVTYGLLAMHLPRFGIDVTLVDGTEAAAIAAAVVPGRTQVVLVETPANPALSLVDLDAIGAIQGPITVVDSTFATPVVQRPLEHGVDLVLHSATKGIAGHNDALLGVVAGNADLIDPIWGWQSAMGAMASPFDAWNALRGIRTLPVRVARQSDTALRLATVLEGHDAVASVSYPHLASHPQHDLARRQMATGGTVVAFEVRGGADAAIAFTERSELGRIALSLGGPETLLTHPATFAARYSPAERAELGITDGLIRMSVGLEHPDDLERDLLRALEG
ncbi:MAG TPA: aminotransferase class I/II-fold pyridoxal phosphate-dependent enzyme [Acidimicrobiales bacterium]|nr:aminotransferase class I/II-fold pyridoxal phosphate-dependent enzyme [Acidimicrobiales bacterium]